MPSTTITAIGMTSRYWLGLGFNTYRFSLEWARIEPEESKFSHANSLP